VKNQVRTALAFLLIAAVIGLLLRLVQSGWLLLNFKYLLHTHSHVALIGWVYNGCFIVAQRTVLSDKSDSEWYNRLFWLTQITILGMLFSFPFQGYGAVSIIFSTLYIFASYAFGWKLYHDVKGESDSVSITLRAGTIFLLLSSIGPFALGYFMSQGMGDSIFYKLSIYWFLHFLYNGFFLMVIISYALKHFPPVRYAGIIAWSIVISTISLFLLSALWTDPPTWVYAISFVSTVVQLIVFGYWIITIRFLSSNDYTIRTVSHLVLLAFFLKLLFQIGATVPVIQEFINSTVPYSVIGFIHLVMLGFFSLGFLAIFMRHQLVAANRAFRIGLTVFVLGILLSEIMLFTQALLASYKMQVFENFFEQLTMASTLLPVGILLLLISQFSLSRKEH
jgi:hypothetical protein